MSLRLELAKLYMRRFVRPRLERYATPEEMRAGLEMSAKRLPQPPDGAVFETKSFDVGDRRLDIEWCDWRGSAGDRVVLYLHGGGYVAGSPQTHRSIAWTLARASGARIASLDFRRAPEHPFPAAIEDAVAAFDHLLAQGWPAASIVLAGDSAGGGLAFALAGEIDRTDRPMAAGVIGFSPFLDLSLASPSLHRNATREVLLPVWRIPEIVEMYLAGADVRDPRASPIYADFKRPWRALLQVGSTEALRDDSVRMADKLRDAGGDVRLEIWKGAPHVWQFFAPHVREAQQAIERAGAFARAAAAPRTRETVDRSAAE